MRNLVIILSSFCFSTVIVILCLAAMGINAPIDNSTLLVSLISVILFTYLISSILNQYLAIRDYEKSQRDVEEMKMSLANLDQILDSIHKSLKRM